MTSALLTHHGVLPIALGDNWIYALPSDDGLLLVDAGPDYEGSWEALVAQLEAAGYSAADVRSVVITHAHVDHCGLAYRWQEAGAAVFASAAEIPRLQQGMDVIRYQSEQVFTAWRRFGVPEERIEAFVASRRQRRDRPAKGDDAIRKRWPSLLRGTPFMPDETPADGDAIAIGERRLSFLESPGHTPGTAVLYEEASGALFSGDQLLPGITPNPGMHFDEGEPPERVRSLPDFSRSLRKVRTLGAAHLYPGHGEHTPQVEAEIGRALLHHERRQKRLLRFLRERPLTPYEVLGKFFPHLPDRRLWQAMAEVIGHVDALVERGEAEEVEVEGRLLVRASGRD